MISVVIWKRFRKKDSTRFWKILDGILEKIPDGNLGRFQYKILETIPDGLLDKILDGVLEKFPKNPGKDSE